MRFREFINEVTQVGYKEIEAKKMFGPVYHGTTEDSMNKIMQQGFKTDVFKMNGYKYQEYSDGRPAPMDHLGFGTYFTTVKNIAKMYSGNNTKGIKEFYLDVPRLATINFGAPNTMMKWWMGNGYDMPKASEMSGWSKEQIDKQWKTSTQNLTNTLKSKYDAVWFKGKGIKRLLDGDQICVYDTSRIYVHDSNQNAENEYYVGDRVKIRGIKGAVYITGKRKGPPSRDVWDQVLGVKSENLYSVKGVKSYLGQIYATYFDKIRKVVAETDDPIMKQSIQARVENKNMTEEDAITNVAQYYVSDALEYNFPESLIEKKVAKGARV